MKIEYNKPCQGEFVWQQSASAFSFSRKDIDHICQYILNQHEHNRIKTFEEEYNEFLYEYQKTRNQNKGIRFKSLNNPLLLRFVKE